MSVLIQEKTVQAAFAEIPEPLRGKLLRIRRLIFETAVRTEGVGEITETLKWGQPSYLTEKPKSGSTIRLGFTKESPSRAALFCHCQTDLISSYRELYRDQFDFEGNRALIVRSETPFPKKALSHCIALALTYHLRKKRTG